MPPAVVNAMLSFEIVLAIAVSTAFAGGAWLLRGVTASGATTGFIIALAIFLALGPGGFAALVAVFLIAWLTTHLGQQRKRQLGLARDAAGRSAAQVLANLGAASVLAVAWGVLRYEFLVSAAIAALAEAAADTAASECGEALSRRAYLITSLQLVAAGTDGGISAAGTMAGVAAAAIVAATAAGTGVMTWAMLPVVMISATAATFIDSLLGATLERRGVLGNNSVNFASTLAAAVIALLIAKLA